MFTAATLLRHACLSAPGRARSSLKDVAPGFFPLLICLWLAWHGSAQAQTVATPTLSVDGGQFATQQAVTVTCATPGATIRYTENGIDPAASDPVVASGGSLLIPAPCTLKVRAFLEGSSPSAVRAADFKITGQVVCGRAPGRSRSRAHRSQ